MFGVRRCRCLKPGGPPVWQTCPDSRGDGRPAGTSRLNAMLPPAPARNRYRQNPPAGKEQARTSVVERGTIRPVGLARVPARQRRPASLPQSREHGNEPARLQPSPGATCRDCPPASPTAAVHARNLSAQPMRGAPPPGRSARPDERRPCLSPQRLPSPTHSRSAALRLEPGTVRDRPWRSPQAIPEPPGKVRESSGRTPALASRAPVPDSGRMAPLPGPDARTLLLPRSTVASGGEPHQRSPSVIPAPNSLNRCRIRRYASIPISRSTRSLLSRPRSNPAR